MSTPRTPGTPMTTFNAGSGGGTMRFALVVDDEAPIRMVVSEKLRSVGFDVQDARDGEEGLEKAKARRPDIIITDLQMPYMSGVDMAKQIAQEPRTASVPMILLTARGHILNQDLLAGTSIRRIVPKPFSARELMAIVEQVLSEEGSGGSAPLGRIGAGVASKAA